MTLLADGIAYNVPQTTDGTISTTTPIPGHIDRFDLLLIAGTQASDVYSYIDELSSTFLNLTGGATDVSVGFIPTENINMLKLYINGVESTILSVIPGTLGSINFTYPSVPSYGYYSFVVKLNGISIINSQIRYYKYIPKLFSDQLIIARSVLSYAGIVTNDPCSYPNYITCAQHNSMFLYVEKATVYNGGAFKNISEDLTAFWNATEINVMGNLFVLDYFYLNMYRFTKLKSLIITFQVNDIPSTAVFPSTLETLVLNTYGGSVNNRFFNSNLKQLNIYTALTGFNVSPCPVNNKLEKLFIPVTSTQGLPQNGFNLQSLDTLSISINSYQFTLPNDFDVQFPNIPNLEFRFGIQAGKNTFDFPSSVEQLTELTRFSVYGDGFYNPTKGYIDLLSSPPLSVFFSEVSQNYIVHANPGSIYYLTNSNVPVSIIDFSNYTSISVLYNNYVQPLPVNTINFNTVTELAFLNSGFYGSVPSEYCKVPLKSLYLMDNNLDGTAPSCFACFSTSEREMLLPNPYSNFNADTPRTCPSFSVETSNIIGSNVETLIVKVKGNDLGFSVSKAFPSSPDISISEPNTELTITIPPGLDTTSPFEYLFHDGLVSFSFILSYPSDSNILAKEILLKYYGISTSDPCTTSYITCKNDYIHPLDQYVDSVRVYLPSGSPVILTEDLTVFGNSSTIMLQGNIRVSDSFYFNLYKFDKLVSLYVDYQLTTVPTGIVYPQYCRFSILYYGGLVHDDLFKGLEGFYVSFSLPGYSIVSSFPVNTKVKWLSLPISPLGTLPTNGFNAPNIVSINNIIHDITDPSYIFPNNYNQFPNVYNIQFQFWPSTTVKLTYPLSVTTLPKLDTHIIYGDGFKSNSIGQFNFLTSSRLYLHLSQSSTLIKSCTQRPCITLPPGSSFSSYGNDFSLDLIDFSNYTDIRISNHIQSERKLLVNTINFDKILSIEIENSNFIGSIPEEYCSVPKLGKYGYGYGLKLANNKLNGTVPGCFKCVGGIFYATSLFPNTFLDFTPTDPPSCPTFCIDNTYNNIVATNSPTVITINGKSLGHSITPLSLLQPQAQISIPNKQIKITVPIGEGRDYKFTYYLQGPLNYSFTLSYSYEKPIITSFAFENGLLSCNGSGFSYGSNMGLVADGIAYTIPKTTNGSISVATTIPSNISRFDFELFVGNQSSGFYSYVDQLSKNYLNLTGGSTNVSGIDFVPTSDLTMLNLFINGIESTIISAQPGPLGSIKFNYPLASSYGHYSFVLQYKGVTILNSQVRYFKYVPKLFPDQLAVAKKLLEYSGITTDDPCSYPNYIKCVQHNSMFLYVEEAISYNGGSLVNVTVDLTTFWNASKISVMGNLIVLDSFYLNLNKFVRLNHLAISYQPSNIPAATILPNTLETLSLNMYGGSVDNRFFNSNLKQLDISFGVGDFSISPCPINNKLKKLYIPVTPTQGLPQNGFNLQSLDTLSISINDYQFALPNDFNVQFPNIPNLEFRFGAWSGKKTFGFPSSVEQLTKLKQLFIHGDGFITPSKGYIELLKSPPLTVWFNDVTQNYFVKANPGSSFVLMSSNVPLNNVDFKNYTSISVWYNNYVQELPVSTINFNTIKDITFTQSGFYGNVPSEYCKVPSKSLYLKSNNLNGTVPTCFVCFSTSEREMLLPNPYSNFNANTPRSCPSFNVEASSFVGSNEYTSVFTVKGTDLGFSVSKVSPLSPDVKISKPNTELVITLPPGVDTSISHQYLFHDGLISFTFTFSYPPLISSFSFNSNNELVISGSSFSPVLATIPNSFVINGASHQIATSSDGKIRVPPSIASKTTSFSFYVIVGSLQSNIVGYSTSTLLRADPVTGLNVRSGSATVTGNFGQYIDSLFSISINNEPCSFIQLTSNSVKVNYPVVSQFGSFPLKIYSNGQILTSTATYTNDFPPESEF
ncbi:hypothetical protein DICPUDRAFT_154716 [Dictyostelium purpureum]|uniref:Uncharacterized protein n=1 Tax=Dictyostelium purpureum TaxID=5786 RepID=F0ZS29_DICPU|nr:uncharacterized protein DICPUDRAFT_154716 [Dictyostelium purpureum]EGC33230.1 hypothetical protein DICPUDRAFT_154716 [Dictyostelium purpureum]|eukprot:XP_003290223.1 hypothetical protein DICPUDRAFT_154716 [Dictyostelium purpureum]